MKGSVVQLAGACLALASVGQANAAKLGSIKLNDGSTAILLAGAIEHGDGAKFRAEANKYDQAVVILESDGGTLSDALEIGEAIRLKGYATAVLNGSDCNSSCALIWLAGSPRRLSKSGRIGFHAAYTDNAGSPQESGVANAMVGRYLTLLNLSESAVIFATSAPPTKLTWLTAANYTESGISVDVIGDVNWDKSAVASSPPTPPVIQTVTAPTTPANAGTATLWKTLSNWAVYVDPSLVNGCFLLTSYPNFMYFRIGVDRSSKDQYYLMFSNPAWTSLQVGKTYDIQLQLGSNSPWNAPARAVQMDNSRVLYVAFKDPKFWTEFMDSPGVTITRNGASVAKLSVAGSKEAFSELVACQKHADSQTRANDPFAN